MRFLVRFSRFLRCLRGFALCFALALAGPRVWAAEAVPAASLSADEAAQQAFDARDWKALEVMRAAGELASPRALSLAANALWYQSRWGDALALMERLRDDYPAEVKPYAGLLSALALERTGRVQDAYKLALELYKAPSSSDIVRYYSMYCLERLTSNVDEKEKWLRRMASSEANTSRRAAVLSELNKLNRLKPADALEILRLEPQNAAALKAAQKAPDSPQKFYRLGYAAYLKGDHARAVQLLGRLSFSAPYGESGTYYRAVSLQRLDRSPEALPLFEKLIRRKDADYIQRSMSRIRLMEGGKADAAAHALLKKLSGEANAELASSALYNLAVSRWDDADEARNLYLKRYPSANRANTLRWSRGWEKFRSGDFQGALNDWKDAGSTSAQILYWSAQAHEHLGNGDKAAALRESLLEKHPQTIYSFLTQDGGSLVASDAPLPPELQPAPSGALERWGFMTHARMVLEKKADLPSRLRRAKIAQWLGQDWLVYRDLHGKIEPLMTGTEVPRPLLEIVYPRPFRATVEKYAKQYDVDPLFIWSIMKQESGFNPSVSSWVGAAGLMQLMPSTAAGEAKRMGLKNYRLYSVEDNVAMGASHISGLIARYGKSLDRVAAAYNAGAGNVNKWDQRFEPCDDDVWMECVPFQETNGYVKNVLRNYAVYRLLYEAEYASAPTPVPPQIPDDPLLAAPEVDEAE